MNIATKNWTWTTNFITRNLKVSKQLYWFLQEWCIPQNSHGYGSKPSKPWYLGILTIAAWWTYIYIYIYSPTNGKLIGFDSSPHLHARSRRGFVAREECRQLRSDDSWRTWDDLQETTVFPMENMGLSSKGSLKQPGFPILGHNFKWGVSENGLPQRFTLAVADCFWMSLANSKEMANSSPSWMMTHVHEWMIFEFMYLCVYIYVYMYI